MVATESALDAISTLAEPTRRGLYDYVVSQADPVGRDEAADALGITRSLAAFHLDRLADAGLLAVGYRRLGDRRGPGAGRPAKVYRKAAEEFEASAPPRTYRLAAEVFADALVAAGAIEEAIGAARRRGAELGARLARPGATGATAVLKAVGYVPARDPDGILRALNCPFDLVARRHPALTCAMNVGFVQAAVTAAGSPATVALAPRHGGCCIAVSG